MQDSVDRTYKHQSEESPLLELPTLVKLFIILIAFCIGASFWVLPWYVVAFLFVGFCIGLAIFLDLYIAIIVFIIGTFFHPTYWVPQLQELHLARNLAFGILLIWGFHIIIYRDFKIEKAPQNILIAVFFTIGFLSTLKDFDYSFPFFLEVSSKALAIYFTIANLVKSRKQLLFLVWFLVAINFISALVGIYQYTHHIGVYYAPEGILRISGFAEDANVYAMDLVISIPIAIAFIYACKKASVKAVLAGVILIIVAATILSFSRAGLMQLATVMFLSVGIRLIKKNKFLGIMAMVIAIAVMIPLVPQKYWERASTITQFSDPAIGKRLAGWKVGTDLFMENPLIGVGFGMFRYEYFMKSITSSDVRFKMGLDAHNLYIHTAAETGIFGLLFLILLIIFTFKYLSAAKKNFMTKGDLYLAEISSAIQISLLVYLLGGMFISYLQLLIFWIIIPLAVVLNRFSRKESGG
jgi:O-antigen ligase